MDRRTSLAALLGRQKKTATAPPAAAVVTSLDPYTGPFGYAEAAHLLRRTTFGPTKDRIAAAVDAGLENTFALLFQPEDLPDPPVIFFGDADPVLSIGDVWVNAPYASTEQQAIRQRALSLRAWTFGQWLEEGTSIREKLTLFWHNHFVTSGVNDPKFVYHYITRLRENALGNFRELAKMMTVNPAMLRYLNGNQNTKNAPNENYARELLELFTIGKGPQVAPGDYTTYTEDDVIACAKVLTGWRDRGFFTDDPEQEVTSQYVNNRHDLTDKQLSHRFDNQVITNNGAEEYRDLIDLIFTKEECAYNICRRLYRWFIYYQIDEQIETDVIAPMAQVLIDNDYDIQPALEALLRSEHFFDMLNFGPMIKNPTDYLISALKVNKVAFPANFTQAYNAWSRASSALAELDMPVLTPPSVAGYPAYYQEPGYYRIWMNSATLPLYSRLAAGLGGPGYELTGNFSLQIDVLARVQELDNPTDPNLMIEELANLLFPQGITEGQRNYLKGILIPGLPDFEWTVEYVDWLENQDDPALTSAVEGKLRLLWMAMLSMPEYFLS